MTPGRAVNQAFRRKFANNKLVLILTRHTLARVGLANRLLDRHEVVTDNGGGVDTLRHAMLPHARSRGDTM